MTRLEASTFAKSELVKHGLTGWKVRLDTNSESKYLGLCEYRSKTIILNAHHIDINPTSGVRETILHEIAHALCPLHAHDNVWKEKALEIGCIQANPCSSYGLPAHVIDAIRSGHLVECTVTTETQVIERPTYKVTELVDLCPTCDKPWKKFFDTHSIDAQGNDVTTTILLCGHKVITTVPRATPFESFISYSWRPDVISCNHEWNKNQCIKCEQFKPYKFQIDGMKFAESNLTTEKGVGIFDDMGLGKTIQALGIIKYHDEYTPTLYIVKSALKFQFFKQILIWLGPTYAAQMISSSRDPILPGLKSYIISYDLIKKFPMDKLKSIGIKLVVMDECQQIKNPDSSRTQAIRKFITENDVKILPLSGTPWKNRGGEFFPILNLLSPNIFNSHQSFLNNWVEYYFEGNKLKQGGLKHIEKFRELTSNILIRREYNEVMNEFPDINRMKLNIQIDNLSQSTYEDEESDFVKWYNDAVIGGDEDSLNSIELLGRMARMRHITGLAKIPATIGFVEEFIEDTDRKLVIFVHHKDVARILYDEVVKTVAGKFPVYHLNAELDEVKGERFEMQEAFNRTPKCIMIASTLASGEGLNLQTCADAVMHERQWNPQNEDQAAPGRFRRIGQKSNVINITFAQAEGTIDEHIDSIVESKRKQFHNSMNSGEPAQWDDSSLASDLAKRIVEKHKDRTKGTTNITSMAKKVKK